MDFWNREIFGNPLWAWLVFVFLVVATGFASRLASWALGRAGRVLKGRLKLAGLERILETVRKPLTAIVLLTGLYLALSTIQHEGESIAAASVVRGTYVLLLTLAVIVALSRVWGEVLELLLRHRVQATASVVDDKLVPVAVTLGRVVIWALGLLIALSNAGIDVTSLIAGLGIGGIAVAMAAKDTLANLFGGVSLFADKVFELGDEVTVRGVTGKVERIGFRTTRIRTGDDSILVVPNSVVADSPIENLSQRRKRRQVTVLPLAYGTSFALMQAARRAIFEVLEATAGVEAGATVRFEEFSERALRLKVVYWIEDQDRFADLVDGVNSEVLRRLDELDVHFAEERGASAGMGATARSNEPLPQLVERMDDLLTGKGAVGEVPKAPRPPAS